MCCCDPPRGGNLAGEDIIADKQRNLALPWLPWLADAPRGRLIRLDILRGLAILLVIGNHFILAPDQAGFFRPLALWMFRFGWTGVDLFFVLSGWLIGGLLFAEIRARGELDFRRFVIRRGFKIWPAYMVYILALWLFFSLSQGESAGEAFRRLLPNFLHLQNYLGSPRGHTWSLAVEEHFYLLLPLFLVLVLKQQGRDGLRVALPVAAITLFVGCALLRLQAALSGPFDFLSVQFPTHLRLDSLFFGVLLAYLSGMRPRLLRPLAARRRLCFAAGLMLLIPLMGLELHNSIFYQSLGLTMLYLGWGLILLAAVAPDLGAEASGNPRGEAPPDTTGASAPDLATDAAGERSGGTTIATAQRPHLAARLMAWTGYYSYSIYLWHLDLAWQPVGWLSEKLGLTGGAWPWLGATLVYFMFALLGGAAMAALIESPVLRFRDRVFPSRSRV